jgi:hypothetical protein
VLRKQLIERIRQLDGELSLEQSLLTLNGRERVASLRSVSPWLLVGVALLGGALLGTLMVSNGGSKLASVGMTGMHMWRLKNLLSLGGGVNAGPGVDPT